MLPTCHVLSLWYMHLETWNITEKHIEQYQRLIRCGSGCVLLLTRVLCCFQQYWHDASKPYRFVSVAEFAEHFKNFSVGRQIAKDLASPPPICALGGTGRNDPDV